MFDLVSIQPYTTYTQLRYSSSQPDAPEVFLVTKKNSNSFRDAFGTIFDMKKITAAIIGNDSS